MDILKQRSSILLSQQKMNFQRNLLNQINWNNRLIGILGARGTGKTTLLIQRMKLLGLPAEECLYMTLDDIYFSTNSLIITVEEFRKSGGKYLFLDEVHKYPGWSREIKNIYDFYHDLHIIFTGSSIIEILALEADLSRRTHKYNLNGLSFREFMEFENGTKYPVFSLSDILVSHTSIASDMNEIKPLKEYRKYLEYGYYPFFKEDIQSYSIQLASVINLTIEYDLAFIENIDKLQVRKIYQLLSVLATQVPFKPNMTELAKTLEMGRGTLIQYFHYLEKAKLIQMVFLEGKGMGVLEKPGKLLLDNPNLFTALSSKPKNEGSRRECFFVNQLRNAGYTVDLSKKADFLADNTYTFEVGGASKNFNQIAGVANSFIAADDIEIGSGYKIPLWLLGFLY